jgi:hypothetical protein
MRHRPMMSLAVLLLAGSLVTADDLKSGPPVGCENNRSGFKPQFVTGPSAGQNLCPV